MGLCIMDRLKPFAQLAALMRGKTLHTAVHIRVHVLNGSVETEGSLSAIRVWTILQPYFKNTGYLHDLLMPHVFPVVVLFCFFAPPVGF